ncbi:MAG: hypothetical protein L3J46_03300, partial [Kangiellaceae bacterium]|nr:hypothetical protein [Kangiellaceae bacterium]
IDKLSTEILNWKKFNGHSSIRLTELGENSADSVNSYYLAIRFFTYLVFVERDRINSIFVVSISPIKSVR